MLCTPSPAATLAVGDTAPDLALPEFGTGEPVSLYEFEDHVVLLDFFVHSCPYSRLASSELGPHIREYYRQRGGNPAGMPVQVISVNTQSGDEAETQQHIDIYGIEVALDDPQKRVYSYYGSVPVPVIAIINGAAPANYDQWEILYVEPGYASGGYHEFRSIIDSVVPEPATLALLPLGGLALVRRRHGRTR